MIVGGGLRDDNADIYRAFFDRIAPETGRVAVIPGASSAPIESAHHFAAAARRHGFDPDRIDTVNIAMRDDASTPHVDESAWGANVEDEQEIAKISEAAGIWFTGGDQLRLIMLLLTESGDDTAMLAAIRQRLEEGAVVGGTSAGAAVMSRLMIAGGDSMSALMQPITPVGPGRGSTSDGPGLLVAAGLGFIPFGIVDQHFDERARLGRLVRALAILPSAERIGFGVDENTALIVDFAGDAASIVGTGAVTLLDGRASDFGDEDRFSASKVSVSVFSAGDRIVLQNLLGSPAAYKNATIGAEYYEEAAAEGGGMALPYSGLGELLGAALVDNSASTAISRASFGVDGRGVIYRFKQKSDSQGFWGRDDIGVGRYTVLNVRFSVSPATIVIKED